MPTPSVSSEDPSSATVASTPTSMAENPSAVRWTGNSTATKPSPKSRTALAAKRDAVGEIDAGEVFGSSMGAHLAKRVCAELGREV